MKFLDKSYELKDSEYDKKIENILINICKNNNIYKNNIDIDNKKVINLSQDFYYQKTDLEKYNFIYKCNIRSNGCEVTIYNYNENYNKGDTCISLIENKIKIKIDLEEKKGKIKIKKELLLNDENIQWSKANIYKYANLKYANLTVAEGDFIYQFAIKDDNIVWGLYNMYKYGYNLLQYNYYKLKGTATDIKDVNEEIKKVSLDTDKELALESFINYNLQAEYSFINNNSKIKFQTLYHCLKNIQENGFDYVYRFNKINENYIKNKDLFKDFENHNGYFDTLKILLNVNISIEDLYELTRKCENQNYIFNNASSFVSFFTNLLECEKITKIDQSKIKDIAIFNAKFKHLRNLICSISEKRCILISKYFEPFNIKTNFSYNAAKIAYDLLGARLLEEVLFYANMKLKSKSYLNVYMYTLSKENEDVVVLVNNEDLLNDVCIANIIFTKDNQFIGKEECNKFLNEFFKTEDINNGKLSINA